MMIYVMNCLILRTFVGSILFPLLGRVRVSYWRNPTVTVSKLDQPYSFCIQKSMFIVGMVILDERPFLDLGVCCRRGSEGEARSHSPMSMKSAQRNSP